MELEYEVEYNVLENEIEEYYNTFYLGPPRAFDYDDLERKMSWYTVRLEEWMPEKVKKKIDAAYGVAVENVIRFTESLGVDVDLNRRELYVLCWLVHRSLRNGEAVYGAVELAGEIAFKLYMLRRGIYMHMRLEEVRPVRDLYRESLREFERVAVQRISGGDPAIQRVLGASYIWFRSRNPVVWTSMQCATRITSMLLNVPYVKLISAVYPWKPEPRGFLAVFRRLGIEVESRPPYTVIDRLILPNSLCRALEKVVELPSFVECLDGGKKWAEVRARGEGEY